MSKLLINESPLQVLPTLAAAIGLNEAIALQQLHYLINQGTIGRVVEGERWIYMTTKEWQERHFPFWSESTVVRVFASLREKALILAANHNHSKFDRTLWYRIDYTELGKLDESILSEWQDGKGQVEEIENSEVAEPIPETSSETSSEKKQENNNRDGGSGFAEACRAYESMGVLLNPIVAESIKEAVDEYPDGWVVDAIAVAAKANKRTWNYINGVLRNWHAQGYQDGKTAATERAKPPRTPRDGEIMTSGGETFIWKNGKPQRIPDNATA